MKKSFIFVIVIFHVTFWQQDLVIAMDQPEKDEEMVIKLLSSSFQSLERIFYGERKKTEISRLSDLFPIEQHQEHNPQEFIIVPTSSLASVSEYKNLMVQEGHNELEQESYIDDAVEEHHEDQFDATLSVQIIADKNGMYTNNVSHGKKSSAQSKSYPKKKKKPVKNTVQNNKSQTNEKDPDLAYLDAVIAEQQKNSSKKTPKVLKKNEYKGTICYINGQKKYQVDIKDFGKVVSQSFLDMADLVPSYIDNPEKFFEDSDAEYWDATGCPFVLEALVDYLKFNKDNNLEVINHFLTWQIQDNLYTYYDVVFALPTSRQKNLQLSFIRQMGQMLKDATPGDIASLIIENQTNLKPFIEDMFDSMNEAIDNHIENIQSPAASALLWKNNGEPFIMKALARYLSKGGDISEKMSQGIVEYQLKTARHKLYFRKDKNSLHYIKAQNYNDFAIEMENMITKKA
jgi:hypothetical protein